MVEGRREQNWKREKSDIELWQQDREVLARLFASGSTDDFQNVYRKLENGLNPIVENNAMASRGNYFGVSQKESIILYKRASKEYAVYLKELRSQRRLEKRKEENIERALDNISVRDEIRNLNNEFEDRWGEAKEIARDNYNVTEKLREEVEKSVEEKRHPELIEKISRLHEDDLVIFFRELSYNGKERLFSKLVNQQRHFKNSQIAINLIHLINKERRIRRKLFTLSEIEVAAESFGIESKLDRFKLLENYFYFVSGDSGHTIESFEFKKSREFIDEKIFQVKGFLGFIDEGGGDEVGSDKYFKFLVSSLKKNKGFQSSLELFVDKLTSEQIEELGELCLSKDFLEVQFFLRELLIKGSDDLRRRLIRKFKSNLGDEYFRSVDYSQKERDEIIEHKLGNKFSIKTLLKDFIYGDVNSQGKQSLLFEMFSDRMRRSDWKELIQQFDDIDNLLLLGVFRMRETDKAWSKLRGRQLFRSVCDTQGAGKVFPFLFELNKEQILKNEADGILDAPFRFSIDNEDEYRQFGVRHENVKGILEDEYFGFKFGDRAKELWKQFPTQEIFFDLVYKVDASEQEGFDKAFAYEFARKHGFSQTVVMKIRELSQDSQKTLFRQLILLNEVVSERIDGILDLEDVDFKKVSTKELEDLLLWVRNCVLIGVKIKGLKVDNRNCGEIRIALKMQFVEYFKSVSKDSEFEIRLQDLEKLQSIWGNLEVFYTLAARFASELKPKSGKEDEFETRAVCLPLLAKVLKVVCEDKFLEYKYFGDTEEKELTEAQIGFLKGECLDAWVNNEVFLTDASGEIKSDQVRTERFKLELKEDFRVGLFQHLWELGFESQANELFSVFEKTGFDRSALMSALEKLQGEVASAKSQQLFADIAGLKKKIAGFDLIGFGESEGVVLSVFTDNPKLLLSVGDLVDAASCQNFKYGSHVESLLGYVVDANVKLFLSFPLTAKNFENRFVYEDFVSTFKQNPKDVVLDFKDESLTCDISWKGKKVSVVYPKATYRRIVKVGQTASGETSVLGEKLFSSTSLLGDTMEQSWLGFLGRLREKMKAVPEDELTEFAQTRNPLGIYSDLAEKSGIQKSKYKIDPSKRHG